MFGIRGDVKAPLRWKAIVRGILERKSQNVSADGKKFRVKKKVELISKMHAV